ncbi:MAG: hypothetical protein Q8P37_00445, partial [Candidatus Spechtbacteria bacterium]|nr:hypothetical protein [Candidatus Spechtbacteria bacterium]
MTRTNERWLNPHQERAVQRRQTAEIEQLPILEQAEMLEKDAKTLAEVIEFGRQVREMLTRFGNASAIPEI